MNEQECEQGKLREGSLGRLTHGNAVVGEPVTAEEEEGGAVLWKSAVFKWRLWLHSPAIPSSLLPEVSALTPTFCGVGTSAPLVQQVSGWDLSEGPPCSSPDSVRSLVGP